MGLPGNLGNRFSVLRILHEGPEAAVYCVSDSQSTDDPRTLKLLSEPGPNRLNTIAAEYRLLRGVRHPNLTGVREFGRAGDGYWLLRDFVDGPTLLEQGPLLAPPQRLQVLRDLLHGLAHLHALGILHLDIKPQNVLLQEHGGSWRAILSDFGFAAERGFQNDPAGSAPRVARGTPPYVAPEILLGLPADERSDLFSLGVTLVETGPLAVDLDPGRLYARFPSVPFAEALRLDLTEIGGELSQLLMRLLATDPGDRPRSVADVLRLLDAERAHDLDPSAFATLLRPRPAFRDGQGAERLERFVRAKDPTPVLWLEAPDVAEQQEVIESFRFAAALAGRSIRELSFRDSKIKSDGRDFSPEQHRAERSLSLARQAIESDNLILAVIREEDRNLGGAAATAARMLLADPDDADDAARLLVVSTPAIPEETRAGLLDSCGNPLLLEGLSRERLLRHLQQLEGHTGQGLAAVRQRLERLSQALLNASGGLTDKIGWILRELQHRGDLTRTGSRFDLSRVEPSTLPPAPKLEDQVAALDGAELSVLTTIDLLGGSAEACALESSLELEEQSGYRRLLRDRWLLRDADDQIRLRTPDAGPAARKSLGVDRTRALAKRILGAPPLAQPYRALVLALAGQTAEAVELLDRHQPALQQMEASQAIQLIKEIRDRCAQESGPVRVADRIMAEQLLQSGNLERAAQSFEELLDRNDLAADERVRVLRGAATSALVGGQYVRAERTYGQARSQARIANSDFSAVLEIERGLAFSKALQGSPDAALKSLDSARKAFGRAGRPLPAWMHSLVGTFALRSGRPGQARQAFASGLAVAQAAGDQSAVAVVLSNQATLLMGEGQFERATASLEKAREIRTVLFHPFEEAAILSNLGMLRRDLGELDRAASLFQESARLRLGLGDRQGHAISLSNLASVDCMTGDLAGAKLRLTTAIETFERLGAPIEADFSRCRLSDVFVMAGERRHSEAELEKLQARVGNPRVRAYGDLSRATHLARFGDPAKAIELAHSAAKRLADSSDHSGTARALLLAGELELTRNQDEAARRCQTRAQELAPPRMRPELLILEGCLTARSGAGSEAGARFLRAASEAQALGLPLTRAIACAHAARTLLEVEPVRASAAARDLRTSLSAIRLPGVGASEQPEAKAHRLLGTELATALDMREPRTDESPRGGGQVTTDGIPDEVFHTFVAINRSLAKEQELDRLMERLLEQAVLLTGGRRGFLLLLLNGAVVFDARSGEVDATSEEVSRSIVLDAIRERRPLITANAQTDERLRDRHSIEQLDLRSVICVPFRSELGTEGAVYVDNPIREGAFTTRNLDLLEALAGQAAIAMGNLERRREIERLNRQLEQRIVSRERELDEARRLLRERRQGPANTGLVGESDAIQSARHLAERFATTDMAVLLLGESGTGKEVFAHLIHDHSRRAGLPFVVQNCSAVPEALLESEFFGHTKGAFTGADRNHDGLFSQADGGTLFLDEVGDMPAAMQAKLLRVLQENIVRPVGSLVGKPVDVRLVCATHRDLEQMVQSGAFREDLYYRVRGAILRLPPLRERLEDVPTLAAHFLEQLNQQHGRSKQLSDGLLRALMRHSWPGNIRELKTEIIRLFHMTDGEVLSPSALELTSLGTGDDRTGVVIKVKAMSEIERDAIRLALRMTGGNRGAAARLLEISRAAFYVKLKKYKLAQEFPASGRPSTS